MNQLADYFPNLSRFQGHCENIASFALSLSSKYGEAARTAVPFVILGCLCVWIYVKRSKSKRMPVHARSKTIRELYGGDIALKRFLDNNEGEASDPATFYRKDSLIKDLLDHEHLDLKKLQSTVAEVEKSGQQASAVEQLKRAENAHSGNPHEAYEIGMLLVELLIYKGDYEDALKHECLTHEEISDARRPLYKAIIYIMRGDSTEEAEKCWEEFTELRSLYHLKPPSSSSSSSSSLLGGTADSDTIPDFNHFRNKVLKLKAAMQGISATNKSYK